MKDSSGIATNARAKGRMKPRTICAVVGMSLSRGSGGAACGPLASDWTSACLSADSMSRIRASPASIPAKMKRNTTATQNTRRRMRSLVLAMMGNRCVMRSVSITNRPIVVSRKMMTSAATSDARSVEVR